MKLKFASIALAALIVSTAPAQAAITIYTTQASYLAAISAPGVDTYNDLDPTTTLSTPQVRTAGAYGYTASVGPLSNFFPAGTASGDVWLSTNNRTDTVTFDAFSASVRGVGGFFFGTNASGLFDGTPATITVTATDGSGTVSQALVNPTQSSFVGFVSTGALTNVQVFVGAAGTGTAGVWPTINDLTLGAAVVAGAVPETGTWLMMLAGFGLVGGAMRRRTTVRFAQAV